MSITRTLIALLLTMVATEIRAGATLDFWHSYQYRPTGETHYGFHLSKYRRGLFWGSCGPSTKSIQWSFNFDLAGLGPIYSQRQFTVSDDDGKTLNVVSGQVVTDLQRMTAKVDLEIASSGRTNKFVGNGDYRIHKIK